MTVVLLWVAAVSAATTGTPIALEEVREASRRATTAQLAELDRLRAAEQVTVARSRVLPQVGAMLQGGYTHVGPSQQFDRIRNQLVDIDDQFGIPSVSLSVSVNQSVFDPNLWANIGVANAQEEAAKAQSAEDRLTAELEGISRFYELLRAQKTYDVIATRVKSSEELAERAEALFEAGRRRKEDAISARINAVNDRTALVRQQALIAQASARLASWIGRPAHQTLAAQDPGVVSAGEVPTFDQALGQARQLRPQLQAMDALARAAAKGIDAARSLYLPTVDVGASYSRDATGNLSPFIRPERQHVVSGGVTVRWDIFNGFITNAQVQQARLEEQRAQLNLEQARRDVEADLSFRVEQLDAALRVAQISEENLKLAADNLALAQARFEEGAGSTLEIRDAQVKHTAAELQLLESRIDTELARAALERAIGAFGPGAKS